MSLTQVTTRRAAAAIAVATIAAVAALAPETSSGRSEDRAAAPAAQTSDDPVSHGRFAAGRAGTTP